MANLIGDLCDCGSLRQRRGKFLVCPHCDDACHMHCDPKGCKEPHGRCPTCTSYRRGIFQRIILRWYR